MQTLRGRYNTANVMIDQIDDTTKEQIQGMLNHPAFADTYIAVMPDCHAGKGAVVGFTMRLNDYVIPNIIGVDIGCGMLMNRFENVEADLPALDAFIKDKVPSGFLINQHASVPFDLEREVRQACKMIGLEDEEKALRALGSLGGGNHFIEAGFDSEGRLCITIHSGSRQFGMKVADFYQKKAKEGLEKYFIRDQYKDLEFLLVNSEEGSDYFFCLGVAQRFASENRKEMMRRIAGFIGQEPFEVIESVHNFIGDDNVIRKGATPARLGEKVIIPFNMRDGIALCIGKGSSKYNNSAPHGAGRILSRSQARKTLSMDQFKTQMAEAHIYTTTATDETIDEAPGAYKDKDVILANIYETVDVVEFIKPVYNFKAGG